MDGGDELRVVFGAWIAELLPKVFPYTGGTVETPVCGGAGTVVGTGGGRYDTGRGWGIDQNFAAFGFAADTIDPALRGGGSGIRLSPDCDEWFKAGGGCDNKFRVFLSWALRIASRNSGTVSNGTQLSIPSDHASTLCGVWSLIHKSAKQSVRSSNRRYHLSFDC
jgi:hypothetical protein